MKVLAIAGLALRRLLRDRTSIFFVFALPFLIILAVGLSFGGSFVAKLGVVAPPGGGLGADLVQRLERVRPMDVRRFDGLDALRTAVERGEIEAGLVVPDGFGQSLAAGEDVGLGFVARPGTLGAELRLTVQSEAMEQASVIRAARFAEAETAASYREGLERARALDRQIPKVEVSVGPVEMMSSVAVSATARHSSSCCSCS